METFMGLPSPSIEKRYQNRKDSAMVVNLSLDREAVRLLREYSDGPKSHGKFLSELIFEYDRRQEFRRFLEEDGRKELQKLCRQVRKDTHRESNV
jgi:hypothetical protein